MKRMTRTKEQEAERLKKLRGIAQFFGKGLWKGDLAEMREDRPRRRERRRKVVLST
jgi:hypothetical protein